LTSDEAQYFASRRWNYGFYRNRYFSIHPTRKDDEIKERYLDNIYKDEGEATIRATVSDARESLFMPALYRIEDVETIEGGAGAQLAAPTLRQVISYEGLYRDIVDSGERIEAKGKLESVTGRYYRLLVGTTKLKGKGYIKPARKLTSHNTGRE
jgi:predicted nucleotidyltransferase